MPIGDFDGKTFVAFTDIAGFKAMMKDGVRGPMALDALYASGFHALHQQAGVPKVEGIFISDCGILFVQDGGGVVEKLQSICKVVEEINRLCFKRAVSLTTSIAWGDFSYHQRIEFPGITKNPVYGNAYVDAFIDCESDSPKMYPNECRISRKNLPEEIIDYVHSKRDEIGQRCRETKDHIYFEWMRGE